jgi:hypothetical protein
MFDWKYATRKEKQEVVALLVFNLIGWIVIFWLALEELVR